MNKYLLFFLALLLFGCSQVTLSKNTYKPSKKERVTDEILASTALRLKAEKGLQPFGSGGQAMDKVKMLELAFLYNKPLDIEEGRKLLVYAVETFVTEINSDERIRPYLYNFPFEPKNVEVRIVIQYPNQSSIESEQIVLLTSLNGKCRYDVDNLENHRLKTIHEELFLEAQQKIKQMTPQRGG